MHGKRGIINVDQQYCIFAIVLGMIIPGIAIPLASSYTIEKVQVLKINWFNEEWDSDFYQNCNYLYDPPICTPYWDYDYICSWNVDLNNGKTFTISKTISISSSQYHDLERPGGIPNVELFCCLEIAGFDFGNGIQDVVSWNVIDCNQ